MNAGCANACTGEAGLAVAHQMAEAAATAARCAPHEVLVASTGVIGMPLSIDKIRAGVAEASAALSATGSDDAMRAIMTTDPFPKGKAVSVTTADGRTFAVGGIAKGSGMIEPRMATMLGFLTTDAKVAPAVLQGALRRVADETFNAITVDGECSTNDCLFLLASGASGVTIERDDDPALLEGLRAVSQFLAREIVRGGEGATKLVTVRITGAATHEDAWLAARTIANSPLVKTAIHGGDPNWGRLVAAAGRSGAAFVLDSAISRRGIGAGVRVRRAARRTGRRGRRRHAAEGIDRIGGPRHRRSPRRHDVDVRLQRGIRAHQRGVPDMSPQARKKQAEFPVTATERLHVPVKAKDFLSILDLSHEELERVLDLATELKQERANGIQSMQPLAGKHVALLFEKPSLRTRTTFTIAVRELGGAVIEPHADVAFGGRETH